MKNKNYHILMIAGVIITLIGLMTGKFIFAFLMIPFGFGLFRKSNSEKDGEDDEGDPKKLD